MTNVDWNKVGGEYPTKTLNPKHWTFIERLS